MKPNRRTLATLCALLALGIPILGCSSNDENSGVQPPLRVDRASCVQAYGVYPLALAGAEADALPAPSSPGGSPFCSCTVGWAEAVPLVALLDRGGVETPAAGGVRWTVSDPSVAAISPEGVVTFLEPGAVEVRACLEDVCSEPYPLTGIENPKVVALEIYPDTFFYPMPLLADGGVVDPGCPGCVPGPSLRILVGDTASFFARGILETGSWVDLSGQVAWASSEPGAASLDADGLLTALAEGNTEVTASYESLTSNTVGVEVLDEAVLQDIYLYRDSWNGILKKGSIDRLHVDAYYDPWMARDVTAEAAWILSDPARAEVSPGGILTALAPGFVTVRASFQGKLSPEISIEIWDEVDLEHCDPSAPNRSFWSDEYNRVILESDCARYTGAEAVTVRYTIEQIRPHEWGILDPCLDLVVLDASGQVVKTLRYEGCGDLPFAVEAGAPADFRPIYQYSAVWDRTDDGGAPVAAGAYTIAGRFYIYYDPVIRLGITLAP